MEKFKNDYRKFLVNRLSYFRANAKLSARELSNRLGYSDGYFAKFEMGGINMPTETFLDALTILNVSPEKFFSQNPQEFEKEQLFLNEWRKLSEENKNFILQTMQKLKN